MWQAGTLQGSLEGIDAHGIRPVLRPATTLAAPAPPDMARLDRRSGSRRHSDSEFGRVRPSELAFAAAHAALDRIDIAILLLHADRRVLLSNSAAMRTRARGDCFHVRAQRMNLVDIHGQRALEAFLGRSATLSAAPGAPICVASRDNGTSCYFLFAEWLDLPSACDGIASLQIHEPRLAGKLNPEALGTLYGLTRTESSLVAALYSTPLLQVAADQCGISLNTAKTHLKHVFAKCGVHSKAELLRLLALGPRIPG